MLVGLVCTIFTCAMFLDPLLQPSPTGSDNLHQSSAILSTTAAVGSLPLGSMDTTNDSIDTSKLPPGVCVCVCVCVCVVCRVCVCGGVVCVCVVCVCVVWCVWVCVWVCVCVCVCGVCVCVCGVVCVGCVCVGWGVCVGWCVCVWGVCVCGVVCVCVCVCVQSSVLMTVYFSISLCVVCTAVGTYVCLYAKYTVSTLLPTGGLLTAALESASVGCNSELSSSTRPEIYQQPLNPLLGVTPLGPLTLMPDHVNQLHLLEAASKHLPQPSDSERVR